MNYKLPLVISFVFVVHFSYSQKEYKKDFLSLSIGGSIPVGSYSGTDFSNSSDGFAKLGQLMNVSFSHKLNQHLALTAMLYGQRNAVNSSKLESDLSKQDFFLDPNSATPRNYSYWVVDKKSWYVESIQIGITEEVYLSEDKKVSFLASALVGPAYAQLPKMQAQSFSDTSYVVLNQSAASAFAFSYSINASLKYAMNKKFSLLFNAGYFGTSKINFKNVNSSIIATNGGLTVPGIYSFSNSVYPIIYDSESDNIKQTISSINISVGLGLSL